MIDLLTDTDMGATEVTVISAQEGVDDYGYRVAETVTAKIIAIVQPSTPEERQVLPEAVRNDAAITLYTVSTFVLSDQVIWQDQTYTVQNVEPWDVLGNSYCRAVAVKDAMS